MVECLFSVCFGILVTDLCFSLCLVRIADVLGAEKARFLLRKTEVLEASGGLKILVSIRRWNFQLLHTVLVVVLC